MARVTVEDCLEREDNRFALVVLAAQRTRALMKGATPLVQSKNKAAVVHAALIEAGAPWKQSDERDAFLVASYARTELGMPGLSLRTE